MKKIKLVLILSIAIMAISCNKNRIFDEHKKGFDNFRWEKSNVLEFTPNITDKEQDYKIYLALRHVYGFQLTKVKLKVDVTSPSGKKSTKSYELKVIDDKNEYYSECAGDYCDLEVLVEDNFKFDETGQYKYNVSYDMKMKIIPNVMMVGMMIDKAVKE